jgi:hypothetical protein
MYECILFDDLSVISFAKICICNKIPLRVIMYLCRISKNALKSIFILICYHWSSR